jgi:hypothetical protein
MQNFQESARRELADFASDLRLDRCDLIESGNGTEYMNHWNTTLFTVYHKRLDGTNRGFIEVAIGLDNIAFQQGYEASEALAWLTRTQSTYSKATNKSPHWWPRVALRSMDEVKRLVQDLRTFISGDIGSRQAKDAVVIESTPPSIEPIDERVLRSINTRRGQPAFRNALLAAYDSACAVSGCTDEAALEAAHLTPHSEITDYSIANGLLLRADIHTLFDLRLISVDPQYGRIVVSSSLSSTYRTFADQTLRLPASPSDHPDPISLMRHYRAWQRQEAT